MFEVDLEHVTDGDTNESVEVFLGLLGGDVTPGRHVGLVQLAQRRASCLRSMASMSLNPAFRGRSSFAVGVMNCAGTSGSCSIIPMR